MAVMVRKFPYFFLTVPLPDKKIPKPMTSFWDNPDPFLLFIVLGFTRRMIKLKLRGNIAKSDNQNVNSVRFWRVQSMDERTQTSDLFKN